MDDKLIMTDIIKEICDKHKIKISNIQRLTVGQGNYVFLIISDKDRFVIRLSQNSYEESIRLLNLITSVGVNVPETLYSGQYNNYNYMICSFIEGKDIGLVYDKLTDEEKRTIAKEVIAIQNKVSKIAPFCQCSMLDWVNNILERARYRIKANGYFDTAKVDEIEKLTPLFETYFQALSPVVYLDDISTKNLMIHEGHVSGVVDIDWLECGDPLTFVSLTNVALLDMEYDTDYVKFLLDELNINELEYKVFLFYSLIYCVDFMGERGSTFNDKTIEVNENIVSKLNSIFIKLHKQLMY